MNYALLVLLLMLAGFVLAGWYSVVTIDRLILLMRARRAALLAYRAEWTRVMQENAL